mmetsp:Transcript_57251/g.78062  ORF Transcript_57251/g.78062 Transcript_57251/m.78062 type:complete len:267 (-) Transcript_57251:1287-2087(-)
MSLDTVCFSMYSDMSNRMMLSSWSNMFAARALQISVLPTPVGPRKKRDATGLVMSLSPARDLWMASAIARAALSCPITRSLSRPSRDSSFSFSEDTRFVIGIPVQLATTSAISSALTVSLSMKDSDASYAFSSTSNSASTLGISLYLSSAARFRSKSRSALSTSFLRFESFSFISWIFFTLTRSTSHISFNTFCSSVSDFSSASNRARRPPPPSSFSTDMRSIESWIRRRSISSIAWGFEEMSLFSLAAASSTRSIALSGRNRSDM